MIGVVIGTFGDDTWRNLGHALSDVAREANPDVPVISSHDRTLADARNTGAKILTEHCDVTWLCFLDADDSLESGYLPAMRRRVDELDRLYGHRRYPALLMPAVRYVNPDGTETPPGIPNGTPRRPLWEINRGVIGTLIDAHTFAEVDGFRELSLYEDWDLWLRAIAAGARVHEVVDAVYRVNYNPEGRNRARDVDSAYWSIRKEHER